MAYNWDDDWDNDPCARCPPLSHNKENCDVCPLTKRDALKETVYPDFCCLWENDPRRKITEGGEKL
jgi:hypothetical protein